MGRTPHLDTNYHEIVQIHILRHIKYYEDVHGVDLNMTKIASIIAKQSD